MQKLFADVQCGCSYEAASRQTTDMTLSVGGLVGLSGNVPDPSGPFEFI